MRALLLVPLVLLSVAAPQGRAQNAPATPPAYVVPADAPAHVRRAIASPDRTQEQRARDYYRKPAEILMLSGIKEGDRIIEIASFGQYFTTLLLAAIGPTGRVDMYDLPYIEQYGGPASREFDAKHANAEYHQESYNDVTLPKNVDSVWNVLYYHDLQPNGVDIAAFNRKIFDALPPDRPPTVEYKTWPDTYVPPFSFPNPVGKYVAAQ